jgi:hypothetical protein
MAYNGSEFAVELPDAFPSPGQVLQNGIALNERRQEKNDALLEKQKEFQQRNALAQQEKLATNRLHNINTINKATDYNQYATADEHINDLTRQGLEKIKSTALQNINSDPMEVQSYLDNTMKELINWHSAAQTDLAAMKAQAAELNKTLPNTDLTKVNAIGDESILNKFTTTDANGKRIPRPYNSISQAPTNHFDALNNENILSSVVNDTKPLYDAFKSVPKTAFEKDNYTNNKGKVFAHKVGGYTTPYSKLGADENGQPILEPNYTVAPGGIVGNDGQPIKLASPELKTYLNASPVVAASLNKEWADYKAKNGLTNMDSHTDEIMKDNFIYDLAKKQLPHDVKQVEVQKTPVTNISLNANKETPIKDAYAEIVSKLPSNDKALSFNKLTATTQDAVLKLARENYGQVTIADPNNQGKVKTRPLNQSDITIYKNPNNGEVGVWTVKPDEKGITRIDQFIAPLGQFDVNSTVNKGASAQKQIIKNEAKPYNSYSINGKDYTHDELLKMGYKDDQIQQALKIGTIKHK